MKCDMIASAVMFHVKHFALTSKQKFDIMIVGKVCPFGAVCVKGVMYV